MNLRVRFEPLVPGPGLSALRREYLGQLPEAQVLLVETLVAESQAFAVHCRDGLCGYFILHPNGTLLEFHLRRPQWASGDVVMKRILAEHGVRRAWVKSFDHVFVTSAMPLQTRVRPLGLLGRDYVPRPLPSVASVRFEARTAEAGDLPRIARVEQSVFDDPERLRVVVDGGYLTLYEHGDALIGFGIVRPVIEGRRDVELGIAVDTPFRGKGHAVFMLRDMVERALAQGLNPVGSCAVGNPASRHMSERVGLVARYLLLELEFPGASDGEQHAGAAAVPAS